MKKIYLLFLSSLLILVFALPTLAETGKRNFDQLVKAAEMKEKTEKLGKNCYLNLADSVAERRLKYLVPQFLTEKDKAKKLALSCALILHVFPNGDPANWKDVDGYLPCNTNIPMQLCALDAFMQAVVLLAERGDTESLLAARYLVERLGSSSHGKYYFITETPLEFRQALDTIVKETYMVAGAWTSDKITGHLPLTPCYGGCISDDYAIQEQMQFFDGMYQIASIGPYAWNRRNGKFYFVISTPSSRWN